jgi:DNA-binding XRE family transcriptional regulator
MQSGKIIACVGMRDGSMVVWFDGGKARTYSTAKDFGISDPVLRRTATVSEDGDNISWEDGTVVWGYDIVNKGKPFDFVTLEKKRILDELTICRKEANFSQTHLGMAAGIRQSVISRIESSTISPQINTLLKLLAPLGKTLAIVDIDAPEEKVVTKEA